MSIKDKITAVKVGFKAGVKATDALLKIADQLEKGAADLRKSVDQLKEITPDDDETETK